MRIVSNILYKVFRYSLKVFIKSKGVLKQDFEVALNTQ